MVIADLSLLKSVGTGVTKEPSGNFEDFDHNASIDARTHVELLTDDNKDLFTAKLDKRSTSYIIKKNGENLYVYVVFSLLKIICFGLEAPIPRASPTPRGVPNEIPKQP